MAPGVTAGILSRGCDFGQQGDGGGSFSIVKQRFRESNDDGAPASLTIVFALIASAVVGGFLFMQGMGWWGFAVGAVVGAGWFVFQSRRGEG